MNTPLAERGDFSPRPSEGPGAGASAPRSASGATPLEAARVDTGHGAAGEPRTGTVTPRETPGLDPLAASSGAGTDGTQGAPLDTYRIWMGAMYALIDATGPEQAVAKLTKRKQKLVTRVDRITRWRQP